MSLEARSPSADQFRQQLKATTRLTFTDFHEGLAMLWESEQHPGRKQDFAERYRKLVGVHPSQRGEFKAALERIEAGGGMPVSDLIETFRRDYAKVSSGGEPLAGSRAG